MKETLVILAAGIGSRYGSLKQIDGVGNHNEPIIEFTIYDAIKTGIKKVILIIKEENKEAFEDAIVSKIRPYVEVEYAFQNMNDIPKEIIIPEDRTKPWGTTHALLSTRNLIKEDPFIVCNADDFYGRNAFEKIINYFHDNQIDDEYCMVGYKVENTLSDNGSVTRGLCEKDDNDYLKSIKEVMNIRWDEYHNKVLYDNEDLVSEIELGSPVSMNFWGFKPNIYSKLNNIFIDDLKRKLLTNPIKYEALLPNHVGQLIIQNEGKVKVLTSNDSWFGVTYKADKPNVVSKIQSLKDKGIYPDILFE